LDLSLESIVLKAKYKPLFPDEIRENARQRLNSPKLKIRGAKKAPKSKKA